MDVGVEFELNLSIGLLLDYDRSITNVPARNDVTDLDLDEIAATQLNFDGEVERGFVP